MHGISQREMENPVLKIPTKMVKKDQFITEIVKRRSNHSLSTKNFMRLCRIVCCYLKNSVS